MQITLTIPDVKLAEFRAGFLAMYPVPMIPDPNDTQEMIPKFTELEWFVEWIRRDVLRAYQRGKLRLTQEAIVIDEGIIE